MHFAFTEEQAMIAQAARAFFADHAAIPRVRAAMASGGCDRTSWTEFCTDLGFGGVGIAEHYGGAGLGMVELATIAEAAGAHVAALPLLGIATVGQAIAAGGSERQQAEWLPRLIAGDAIAAYADAELVPYGAHADLFLTPDGRLVPSALATVIALTTMDQTRPLARVKIDPQVGERLADPLAGIGAARAGGLVCLSAEALGGAQECLDRTVAYALERVQFGRAIGSFQAYKHRLADMMVEIEQARSAVYWAACAVDENASEKDIALPAAKSFAADTFFRCAGDMIQLHGGIGFTWEHDAHLFFKRARSIQSLMGDSALHRERVAELMLGAPA